MDKNVLFVCVENSCRSQMAEGFARLHGAGKVAAHSAGSKPSGKVNATAIAVMREKGIDLMEQSSKGLDALPPGKWAAVVTMGCGDACPAILAERRLDWALPDPKRMPLEEFRRVRDEIERRVKELLAEISGA